MSQELERTELESLGSAWEAAWAGREGASFADCCTADVQYEDPLTAEPLHGPTALAGHAERLRTALPDLRLERAGERLAGQGYACLPWRLAATHKGDAGPLPATNRFLVLHGLHYLELSDGRARRARGFFDLYDAAIQLGLLPKRGSLGESALLVLRGFGLRRPTPP